MTSLGSVELKLELPGPNPCLTRTRKQRPFPDRQNMSKLGAAITSHTEKRARMERV